MIGNGNDGVQFPEDGRKEFGNATIVDVEVAKLHGSINELRTKMEGKHEVWEASSTAYKEVFDAKSAQLDSATKMLQTSIEKLNMTIKYRYVAITIAVIGGLGILYAGFKAVEVISAFVNLVEASLPTPPAP